METKVINLRGLPAELVRRVKAAAALHGLTLKKYVAQSLEAAVRKDLPARAMAASRSGASRKRRRGRK
jgi:hypothetical protein